jgi:hypothetical protein
VDDPEREPEVFDQQLPPRLPMSDARNENNQMKIIIKSGLIVTGLVGVICSFVHPYGPVKSLKSDGPLLEGAALSPAIAQVLERSCQNCHSERTVWPWYSYVAPLVAD